MTTVKDESRQRLIDGLSAMVVRGEISQADYDIILAPTLLRPQDSYLDEAILWQLRKDHGLTAVGHIPEGEGHE